MGMSLEAVRAGQDAPFLEKFIAANEPFILRTASRCAGRRITREDDEYSIALLAFHEAVKGYDSASGPFGRFAALVIGRRLTDHHRSISRFNIEVPLAPYVFDGGMDPEEADVPVQLEVNTKIAYDSEYSKGAVEEIQAADAEFRKYGFSFYELSKCSPHTQKTKKECALAVDKLLKTATLFAGLQNTGCLPVTALSNESGVPRKTLDRYRKFIIASALLLDGEYPALSYRLKCSGAEDRRKKLNS